MFPKQQINKFVRTREKRAHPRTAVTTFGKLKFSETENRLEKFHAATGALASNLN
jgi:hypothetical protein